MKDKKIELLAPAGNMYSFKAAVNAGADAVYMGLGKHNARVMAKNFSMQDYIECINYAHIRGVKVYLTLNTLVLDNEIKEVMQMLISLYEHGLDAVILQDIGLSNIIHQLMPDLHMHASTQMSVYSLEQVKFLESLGFKRVVLARELTLDEIKYITQNSNVEIEVFTHGALCVSLSGQCLMSLSIGTRSANRGACAQPCRMRYSLCTDDKKIIKSKYLLSKKDIYGLDILDKIINTNTTSLKIEGRNKTPEYVALVISMYRKYIDSYLEIGKINIDKNDEKELLQIFNRSGKSHGYLDGIEYKDSITEISPKNTGLYLGEVLDKKGNFVKVKLNEEIGLHDGIEIYSKDNVASTIVTCIKDEKMKLLNNNIKKDNIVYIGDIKGNGIKKGDKIYKTSSYKLNTKVQMRYLQKNNRKRKEVLNVSIKENSPITLSVVVNGEMYTYNTNIIPEKAVTKSITLEDLSHVFSKTKDYGIEFSKVVGFVQNGLFIKVSVLNEIRRNFMNKLEEKYHIKREIKNIEDKLNSCLDIENNKKQKIKMLKNILYVYSYDTNIDYDKIYNKKYNKNIERIDFNINDYIKNEDEIFHKYSKYNLGVNISNFALNNTNRYIEGNIERLLQKGVKTIILGSFRYLDMIIKLKEKYEFCLIADYSLNISNCYSAVLLNKLGFDIIVPILDCDAQEINLMQKYVNIELIDNYITVMTSRYCILGSFIDERKSINNICSQPCLKNKYYLLDTYGERYDIVCNNIDCTMKIVKKYKLDKEKLNKGLNSIRNNFI